MMKQLLLFICITAALASCAQQKMGMERMYAFRQVRFPGNVPVDDNGNSLVNGPDTVECIYIETSGKAPTWQNAYKNGIKYTVSAAPIDPTPHRVGKNKKNGQEIIIAVHKGNMLWQLTLSVSEGQQKRLPVQKTPKATGIILEGMYKGKPFRQTIRGQVELLPFESV